METKVKVKVKIILEQVTKARGGEEVHLHSFFNLGARWGGWSTPRSSRFTPGKETLLPLYRRLGGLQGRFGRVRKISTPTRIRFPDPPARNVSQYRLSYPGPRLNGSRLRNISCFIQSARYAHAHHYPIMTPTDLVAMPIPEAGQSGVRV